LISLLDSISGFKVLGVLGRDSLQIDRRALDAPIRYQLSYCCLAFLAFTFVGAGGY
jgi:hypothetical protein